MSRKQRVVIQIDEDIRGGDAEEFRNILDTSKFLPFASPTSTSRVTLSGKTASRILTQPLRFDCVGTMCNSFVRAEFSMLMHELFINKSSCCLLQFFPVRESQLSFLCNLLVSEVDKHMMILQAKLFAIKVEYFDLRKYDVINMLDDHQPRSTIKNKHNSRPHNIFHTTLELLRWLQTKYTSLFSKGQGSENIDLEFTFADSKSHVYTVKLTIMNNYLCQMDADTKTCLRNCFENMRSAKRGRKNIVLTDCLREILSPQENWFTWFIFHVPIAKGRGIVIDDQLILATAAYTGATAKGSLDDNLDLDGFLSYLELPNASNTTIDTLQSNTHRDPTDLTMSQNCPLFLPPYSSRTISNRFPSKNNQSNDLTHWYSKMDHLIPMVMKHIDAFYEYKYSHDISKICNDLKSMLHFDTIRPYNSGVSIQTTDKAAEYLDRLKKAFESGLREFVRLAKDIWKSPDSSTLRVYVESKKNEIKEFTRNCKIRQLEMCQQCIVDTIKSERNSLSKTSRISLEFIKNPPFSNTILEST
ncbi:uncharacterized protein [Eurosta solidaginis]|uniref:uncharacterized protein n=1 Tax=Eurosta solidaginis TaxID=178769 RepID=UPI0035308FE0